MQKKVMLIILDGWGLRSSRTNNAIKLAHTPNYDYFMENYPHSKINPAGESVGLPKGFQGNSEVGHINLGAGRVVRQSLKRIDDSIRKKGFYKNKALLKAINNCKKKDSTLHIMGLVQREGVHAMTDHMIELLILAHKYKLKKVLVHVFTDGRDTHPMSAKKHIKFLEKAMKKLKTGKIATIIGRYYSMDRDTRWPRIKLAYDMLTEAKGDIKKNWKEAVNDSYSTNHTDEFIKPKIIKGFKGIEDGDSVIFANYRFDRTRQLTHAFTDKKFKHFKRKKKPKITYVCMTEYYKGVNAEIAYPPETRKNILAEVLSKKGKRQLRIAETEKYAHVTFFFNSQIEQPFPKEDRILIPSPRIPTYDLQPEMSAPELCKKLVKQIKTEKYDSITVNFANADMVGHTGIMRAIKKAISTIDHCLGKVVKEAWRHGYTILITADHGNAEEVQGNTQTSHTTNKVPLIAIGKGIKKVKNGIPADIAPTILKILEIKQPKEMTGKILIK